jgi:hypothetical protein
MSMAAAKINHSAGISACSLEANFKGEALECSESRPRSTSVEVLVGERGKLPE